MREFEKILEEWSGTDERRFDGFIMEYMGYTQGIEGWDEDTRRLAYHDFLKRLKGYRPATLPTIRHWFGIHGQRQPRREHVLRMALGLGLSVCDAERFLMEGLGEPSFQVNDYTEIIVMYSLENHKTHEQCLDMIEEYEEHLESCQTISHEFNTQWIYDQYEAVKSLPEQGFMFWMWKHADIFKGYSKTTQEMLEKYRGEILGIVRDDMKRQLDLLLAETGYVAWRSKRGTAKKLSEGEYIRKYVNQRMKSDQISKYIGKSILELSRLIYSGGKNTQLMSELYLPSEEGMNVGEKKSEASVKVVTAKRLSDLFNIPIRHEAMICAKSAMRKLENLEDTDPCPADIKSFAFKYANKNIFFSTVEEAKAWIGEYIREGKRRHLMIKRDDLLPMIHYVVQASFQGDKKGEDYMYDCEQARKEFRKMADATLISCKMAPLNEAYRLDRILLLCFQEERMYGYSDVLALM